MGGKCIGTCSILGCGKPVKARKLCAMHWKRWRFGLPMYAQEHYDKRPAEGWIVNGYRWIYTPDGREMLEHRYVMEQKLGRPLLPTEDVHHKDHDRLNNRDDNLELIEHAAHARLHRAHRSPCRVCGKDDPHQARGLCGKHYMQMRRGTLAAA